MSQSVGDTGPCNCTDHHWCCLQAFEYWVPSLKTAAVKVLFRMQESFSDASIVIASYDTLSRTSANFSSKDFQMVIAVSKAIIVPI